MKILAIHNFHRKNSASGDDQVFLSETDLLEKHGNTVIRYTVSNNDFDKAGIFGKLRMTLGMLWSFRHARAVRELCRKEKPDIVHIHTFFPLLSPSVLYAAKRSGCKVVATLHDTRFVCPCATSLRGSALCSDCAGGHYLSLCRHACFKGSRLQSLLVAVIFRYHRIRGSFYRMIDRYICLNDSQITLLTDSGFDSRKIVKKYNFVPETRNIPESASIPGLPERYAVFFGRIGVEKGVRQLMEIWNGLDIPLVMMGGGPLEEEVRAWAQARKNIFFLGYTAHEECLRIVRKAEFAVFPSIWYEGCSMVVIEAESCGKCLIATDLGFSSEAIRNGVNGFTVKPGDTEAFRQKAVFLWNHPELAAQLGANARKAYESTFLPESNYRQLMEIYRSVTQCPAEEQ